MMQLSRLGGVLSAASLLAAPATAQGAVYGISEWITFTSSHTASYTTTLPPRKEAPQVITTVVVTLFVPREVGWPYSDTYHTSYTFSNNLSGSTGLLTGTALSHLSAGATTWAETAQVVWALAGGSGSSVQQKDPAAASAAVEQAPPNMKAEVTLTAKYTDYSHYTTEMYGAWSQAHFDYVSTYHVTVVEEVGANYPATMIQTGYYTVEITATGGPLRGALTTFTNPATLVSARTTTLVQMGALLPTPGLA
ncbi:hypothetical protein V8F33_007627 [Rhypophila sp. PSN 637]